MFRTIRQRTLLLENILSTIHRCQDVDTDWLKSLLHKSPVVINDPASLVPLIEKDCINHLMVLYDYGALRKKFIISLFELSGHVEKNHCILFLQGLIERDNVLLEYTNSSAAKNKMLSRLNPDMIRQLSSMMIGQ
jgi:hypothetical protein